jgi:hypothetical protein
MASTIEMKPCTPKDNRIWTLEMKIVSIEASGYRDLIIDSGGYGVVASRLTPIPPMSGFAMPTLTQAIARKRQRTIYSNLDSKVFVCQKHEMVVSTPYG